MRFLAALLIGESFQSEDLECRIGEHTYNNTCIQDHPCPTDECWRYDTTTGECHFKLDAKCSMISCSPDAIKIEFRSELLGIEDNQKDPFGPEDETKPKWNLESQQWEYYCLLGGCNMNTFTQKGHLVFHFAWELPGETTDAGAEAGIINTQPISKIEYECRYDKRVSLSSEPVEMVRHSSSAVFTGHGDLTNSFKMSVHDDATFLGESERVYLGDTLFVRVEWLNNHASDRLAFFVDVCDVVQGDKRISIVKNNCYARAVDAKFLSGESHLVTQRSEWSFSTFTSDADADHTQTVDCMVQFCVKGEYCPITVNSSSCPKSMPQDYYFGFTTFGQSEK